MEFRKMVTITLYARQQKRHRCIEQSFGLCGRRRGWDDLGEWHWNMYNIYETSHQSRFDAWNRGLRAVVLGQPWGIGWGGRWEGGSGWGTHAHPWLIHASNLDCCFISHMIVYTFQRYPFKPFHTRLLPQSPKDCSLHLCLFCCLAYRVIVTIFLNAIYMR